MSLFGTEIKTKEDLFKHLLQDMYFAETKIASKLPDMAEKASNPQLKQGFETHLAETNDQIEKLELAFDTLGFDKDKEKCEAILGLLDEGEHLIKETEEGPIRDAALIAAAQKIEHYEIASYGTIVAMANDLGHTEAASIIHKILEQEKATDEKLSQLCDHVCNRQEHKRAA